MLETSASNPTRPSTCKSGTDLPNSGVNYNMALFHARKWQDYLTEMIYSWSLVTVYPVSNKNCKSSCSNKYTSLSAIFIFSTRNFLQVPDALQNEKLVPEIGAGFLEMIYCASFWQCVMDLTSTVRLPTLHLSTMPMQAASLQKSVTLDKRH